MPLLPTRTDLTDRAKGWSRDPLNWIALAVAIVWTIVGAKLRPIGDYGVETDFYGDFVPNARLWLSGNPSIMEGYRGPFYYLLLGVVSWFGDAFVMAKLLSAVCAGLGLRLVGGLFRRLWETRAAVVGMFVIAGNGVYMDYAYRASTDLVYFVLFAGALSLILRNGEQTLKTWIGAGLLAGLAYLTRYNGAALVAVGLVAALVMTRPFVRSLKAAGIFVGAWLVTVSPWLLYLWNQTGNPFWNQNHALVAEEVYGTDAALANSGKLVQSVGFTSLADVVRLDPGRFFGAMGGNIPEHFGLDVQHLIGPVYAVLALLGLVLAHRFWRRRQGLVFAAAGLITFAALLPVFYNERFMLTLLIWWAAGIAGLASVVPDLVERWRNRGTGPGPKTDNRRRSAVAVAGIFAVLGIVAVANGIDGVRNPEAATSMPQVLLKLAEEAQKTGARFDETTPIAARKPHIGYYLGAPVDMTALGRGMQKLAEQGMHYVLVSGVEARHYSEAASILSDRSRHRQVPGFDYVASARHLGENGRMRQALLYAVQNPADPDPDAVAAAAGTATAALEIPPGMTRLDVQRMNLARWYLRYTVDEPVWPLLDLLDGPTREHEQALIIASETHLAEGRFEAAAGILDDLYRKSPERKDLLARKSLVKALAGDHEGFMADMNIYAERKEDFVPPDIPKLVGEAIALYKGEQFAQSAAVIIYIQQFVSVETNPPSLKMLGFDFINLRLPHLARSALKRYLELVPDDAAAKTAMVTDTRLAETNVER